MLRCSLFLLSLTILLSVACSNGGQPESETFTDVPRIVDLSYSFEETTLYWPNNMPFQHDEVAYGRTDAGYWYSSFNFAASEHGGTHLDAPVHFAEGKQTVEQIPIERHIGPGVKISIAEQASRNRDYRLTALRPWAA